MPLLFVKLKDKLGR